MLIDLCGYGYFDKFCYIEIKDFFDDIVELFKYLYIEEVVFVCYEMGGIIGVDILVCYFEFILLFMLVNLIFIEGELLEECLFRKYVYII